MPIRGDGPRPALIAIIGEAPAKEEVKQGRPLVGPSGKVTFAFLGLVSGIRRDQVYVDNVWQEQFTEVQEKRGLNEIEMAIAGGRLETDLEAVNPTFILALGKHSAAHFLGFAVEDTNMETIHGLVFQRGSRLIVPAFHPAAGMRDSKRLAYSMNDFKAFAGLVAGRAPIWTPKVGAAMYRLAKSADFGSFVPAWAEVAIDTEYDAEGPIMLTYSPEPSCGFAIYRGSPLMADFAAKLATDRPLVILHNALADIEPLKQMGVDLVGLGLTLRDTMIRAWYQETEGQGLKRLAYRHLGTDRDDFAETVRPYFESQLISYLTAGLALIPRREIVKIGKTGKPLKPSLLPMTPLQRKVGRFIYDYDKGRITNMLKRWDKWEEGRDELTTLLGEAPNFSIRHVPAEIAVPYAASDADDTLGVYHKLPPYDLALEEMDNAKLPLVAAMQARGMLVDMKRQAALEAALEEELAGRLDTLRALAEWPEFNPKSGDQVAEALYGFKKIAPGIGEFMRDREYLNPPNFTKKGKPKTDKKALGQLRADSPLVSELLVYKELDKLQNTYVGPLPKHLRYGLLHPNFTHTRVPSGRLAARNPNIMAIPSRTEWGKRVRALFVARPGFRFLSFDHSQIEIVVAAQVSQDRVLMDILQSGADMHIRSAADITGWVPASDVVRWKTDPKGKMLRQVFKKINYCVAPETPVLTDSLRWVPAGQLKPGDGLLAFDEHGRPGHGRAGARRWRRGIVTANEPGYKDAVAINLANGERLIATVDHRWIMRAAADYTWRESGMLKPGDYLLKVVSTSEREETHDAGWLGGLFDGEGWATDQLGVTQKPGSILDRARAGLQARGVRLYEGLNNQGVGMLHVQGPVSARLELLMRLRPERLISRFVDRLIGRMFQAKEWVRVVSVQSLGEQPIASLSTSTETYIAGGYAAHNTMLYGATAERIYLELLAEGINEYSLDDVAEFRAGWFGLYSGITNKIVETERHLQQYGYIADMWGRRRQLPGAHLYGRYWPMSFLREEAVRQGFSQEIQGGAQGLIIRAMIIFHREVLPSIRTAGFQVYPVLQNHDELMLEIEDKPEAIEMAKALGLEAMVRDQSRFDVPIASTSSTGLDWSEVK